MFSVSKYRRKDSNEVLLLTKTNTYWDRQGYNDDTFVVRSIDVRDKDIRWDIKTPTNSIFYTPTLCVHIVMPLFAAPLYSDIPYTVLSLSLHIVEPN